MPGLTVVSKLKDLSRSRAVKYAENGNISDTMQDIDVACSYRSPTGNDITAFRIASFPMTLYDPKVTIINGVGNEVNFGTETKSETEFRSVACFYTVSQLSKTFHI